VRGLFAMLAAYEDRVQVVELDADLPVDNAVYTAATTRSGSRWKARTAREWMPTTRSATS